MVTSDHKIKIFVSDEHKNAKRFIEQQKIVFPNETYKTYIPGDNKIGEITCISPFENER